MPDPVNVVVNETALPPEDRTPEPGTSVDSRNNIAGDSAREESPETDADVKLAWEIKKLQAEVEGLNRPFRHPSVIAALLTSTLITLASIGGFALQWSRSDREYTLMQTRAERLEIDTTKLENRRAELEKEVVARNADLRG